MPISFEAFLLNLEGVRAAIEAACAAANRDPQEVSLLPVTKTHPAAVVQHVARAGLTAVGENRVQEARDKRQELGAGAPPMRWELIGHLQSNKAKLAAGLFDRIQSVDSRKLLNALERAAAEGSRTLAVLLQINAGRDPAKFGCDLEEAPGLLEHALTCTHLHVEGLMTIAPLDDDSAVAARTFDALRGCRDALAERFHVSLPELSMGMTDDLDAAVQAGSTQVRIGTALFGARE
jgi:PLP dependent protein